MVTDGEEIRSREASRIVSAYYTGQALTGEGKTSSIPDLGTRMCSHPSGVFSTGAKPNVPTGKEIWWAPSNAHTWRQRVRLCPPSK